MRLSNDEVFTLAIIVDKSLRKCRHGAKNASSEGLRDSYEEEAEILQSILEKVLEIRNRRGIDHVKSDLD